MNYFVEKNLMYYTEVRYLQKCIYRPNSVSNYYRQLVLLPSETNVKLSCSRIFTLPLLYLRKIQ